MRYAEDLAAAIGNTPLIKLKKASEETGCTILFMQYPGPTTGAAPLYEGRMNLKKAESEAEYDLNL